MILLLFSFCSTSITMLYSVNLWDFLIYSNKEERLRPTGDRELLHKLHGHHSCSLLVFIRVVSKISNFRPLLLMHSSVHSS